MLAEEAAPECPDGLRYLLDWFSDLARARRSNGFGPEAVGYGDILAWATLLAVEPEPWEVRALTRLDAAWLDAMAKKDDEPERA